MRFQERYKRIDKGLAAFSHIRVVLQIHIADILFRGFFNFVLVERHFVEGQRVGFVALNVLLLGSLRRMGAGCSVGMLATAQYGRSIRFTPSISLATACRWLCAACWISWQNALKMKTGKTKAV